MTPETPCNRRTVLKTLGSAVIAGGAFTGAASASTKVPLVAGQDTVVGYVNLDTVSVDEKAGTATLSAYRTVNGRMVSPGFGRTNGGASEWEITESHLAVGDSRTEFEEKGWINEGGQPRPGRFPYSNATGDYKISRTIPADSEFMVMYHAVVERVGSGKEETAYGGEKHLNEQKGSWARYFEHTIS